MKENMPSLQPTETLKETIDRRMKYKSISVEEIRERFDAIQERSKKALEKAKKR